ncbi:MAG: PEP/pyruvate-binding domain-containing protein [Pseudonocardiaceae bacterium]
MISPITEPLITTDDGARTIYCGGKAAFLLDICHLVAVPEFIVIPPSWFALAAQTQLADSAALWSQWDTAYQKSTQTLRRLTSVQFLPAMREVLTAQLREYMPGVTRFAVRSSAIGEDGHRHSFAGLYDSVLNVQNNGLEQAIIAVWCSWFSVRAVTHRDTDGWQTPLMSVVVQRMVDVDQAGVVAVYGGTVEVEAVVGTGDELVNGTAEPNRHLFSAPVTHPRSPAEHAAALASALRDQLSVGDLEVEWAADRDRVWIVQARPLTARPPTAIGLSWVDSCTHPTLRSAELYADTAPGDVVPLGSLAEVVGHYRTKRRPLYAIGAEHDCDLGVALVVHFNESGLLYDPPWVELVGRLGPTAVLDVSASERQVIIPTSELRQYLSGLCGSDPEALRTVVVREFIVGDCGVLSAVSGADVRVEFSREGLLGLNRGVVSTDEFVIPRAGAVAAAPSSWSDSTLTVVDHVTRRFADRHGDSVVEWVLRAGRPVLVDYSLVDPSSTRMSPGDSGMVISSGSCQGPAMTIPTMSTQTLIDDSVAPVVSVGASLPHPSGTSVAGLHDLIAHLDSPPVLFVDRPYAVLATLIPRVAGFVFTQPAARLCHLAILLRENRIPAIYSPAEPTPQEGEWVALSRDGHLMFGVVS